MDAFDIIAVLVALFPVLVLVVVNGAEHATLVPNPELTPRPLAARPRPCNSSYFVTRGVPRVPAEVVIQGGA